MTRDRCSSGLSTINPASRYCDRSRSRRTRSLGLLGINRLVFLLQLHRQNPAIYLRRSIQRRSPTRLPLSVGISPFQACSGCTGAAGQYFVPLNTRQVNSITGIGWYQNLSRSAPVAIAQAGFSFVPFNTKQVVTVQVAFDPFVKKKLQVSAAALKMTCCGKSSRSSTRGGWRSKRRSGRRRPMSCRPTSCRSMSSLRLTFPILPMSSCRCSRCGRLRPSSRTKRTKRRYSNY